MSMGVNACLKNCKCCKPCTRTDSALLCESVHDREENVYFAQISCMQATQPASKQWGFAIKDCLNQEEALSKSHALTPLRDKTERQSWALGTEWKESPFSLQHEPSSSSSGLTGNSGFKIFKDSCEAGSFTLSPSQVFSLPFRQLERCRWNLI